MNINNLTFSFGQDLIYQNVSFNLELTDHVGIIGQNGAGKSTLFRLILGELEADTGTIKLKPNYRVSLLPQVITDEIPDLNISVFDYLLSGRPIAKIEQEMNELYLKMMDESVDQERLQKRLEYLQSQLDYWEYYEADSILLRLISILNISEEILERSIKELSGGQKSKIAFARLLYQKPEIILLDEPTNHLDQETKDSVIEYLKNYQGMVLVISHDIDFLNQVTYKTLYVDKQMHSVDLVKGNYAEYQKKKALKEASLEQAAQKQEKEINKLKSIVNLYSNSSGKRKRMAQSREKSLDKLLEQKIELRPVAKTVQIKMNINDLGSTIPLSVKEIGFGYDEQNLLYENITFDLYRGEKFLIVGENGVGKSTLLKLIMNQLNPTSGEIKLTNKTTIAYYAQEHETIDNNKTVLENFDDLNLKKGRIRAHLGNFLFSGNDVFKKVSYLSPGERSRLALAKLALSGANLLLLDEPTNHLDPETQEIIANVFKNYQGSMLVVSHNPHFVDKIGIERILLLPSGEVTYYDRKIVEFYEKENNLNKK